MAREGLCCIHLLAKRLSDRQGHHLAEDASLQTPTARSPGGQHEHGGGGRGVTHSHRWRGDGAWMRLRRRRRQGHRADERAI